MALTINQLARERRKYIKDLYSLWWEVSKSEHRTEQFLKKLKQRKKKIPDYNDLKALGKLVSSIISAMNAFQRLYDKGYVE